VGDYARGSGEIARHEHGSRLVIQSKYGALTAP
jgi:hypothetical protein